MLQANKPGSLAVIGTGIRTVGQMTMEAVAWMQESDVLLYNAPIIDSSSQLILWQIGTLGDWTYKTQKYDTRAMPLLVRRLAQFYPLSHPVTVYEAAVLPGTEPMIARIPLYSLSEFPITSAMTLYIPPARMRMPDPEMMRFFNFGTG
jgi:hypothetical protein